MRERYDAMPEETVRPRPLITGRELIAAGYAPGAAFKEMLRAVEDAQLEGKIANADEALQLVREAASWRGGMRAGRLMLALSNSRGDSNAKTSNIIWLESVHCLLSKDRFMPAFESLADRSRFLNE